MPIYEYRCQACGHEEEVLQKISDPLLTECPACKKPSLKKKVSAAGFRLKGGGWYETDFKSGNKKNVLSERSGADDGGKDSSAGKEKGGDAGNSAKSKDGDKKSDSKAVKSETKSSGGGASSNASK